MRGVSWTNKEEKILIENYSVRGIRGTAALIPRHSVKSVQARANRLGCMVGRHQFINLRNFRRMIKFQSLVFL